jgi:hypothetical protein
MTAPPKLPALLYWIAPVVLPGVVVPVGVAQVPSPRQKVVAEALVPLFKLPTGKLPVTSVERLTAPKLGVPAALPCKTVVAVPAVPSEVGAAPAPPPNTSWLAVRAAEEESCDVELKKGTPPLVPVVVNANVPVPVTGDPLTPKILDAGTLNPTDVTVPLGVELMLV